MVLKTKPIVEYFTGSTIKESDMNLSDPPDRINTAYPGDKYTILELRKLVHEKLESTGKSLDTFLKNNKVLSDFDDYFVGNPTMMFVPYMKQNFDKFYQRFDLFNPSIVISSLNSHKGYVKQAEKPFIIFDRPKSCIARNYETGQLTEDFSGLWNPDGQHAGTMAFLADGEDKTKGLNCLVWKFKEGTTLEEARGVESYIFDTMQDVTAMSAESRFKVKFNCHDMYYKAGADAKELGDFLWKYKLNCVDLFDKEICSRSINSIGALKRAFSELSKKNLQFGFDVYKKVWNKDKKTIRKNNITINVDVASAITYILQSFKTQSGGMINQKILIDALVDYMHEGKPESEWGPNSAGDASSLVKAISPHKQIKSGAYRIACVYNNYLNSDSKLNEFSYVVNDLLIDTKFINKLKKEFLNDMEAVQQKSVSDFEKVRQNQPKLKAA